MPRGRAVSTRELVQELWGDTPPPSARANLHSYLSSLRTLLAGPGPTRLSSGPGGYGIDVHRGELDVAEFERLTARATPGSSASAGNWCGRSPSVTPLGQMLALYRSGRTKEALDAYRALHALLDTELGVEPNHELRTLHQAVLSHDPAIAATRHNPWGSLAPSPTFA